MREKRLTTNARKLNTEARKALNPNCTRICRMYDSNWLWLTLYGRHRERICKALPRYRLPADILRYRDGLFLLYTLLEGLLKNRGILSLTCHQRPVRSSKKVLDSLRIGGSECGSFPKSICIFTLEGGSPIPHEGPGASPLLSMIQLSLQRLSSSSSLISGLMPLISLYGIS